MERATKRIQVASSWGNRRTGSSFYSDFLGVIAVDDDVEFREIVAVEVGVVDGFGDGPIGHLAIWAEAGESPNATDADTLVGNGLEGEGFIDAEEASDGNSAAESVLGFSMEDGEVAFSHGFFSRFTYWGYLDP